MNKVFWIWTGFCIVGAGLLIWLSTININHSGSIITLTTNDSYQLTINAESVTIEAASSNFFVLRQPRGEIIVGTLTEKPLGWYSDEYYKSEPAKIQGGVWIVEKGKDITIHITSMDSVTVQKSLKVETKLSYGLVVVGVAFIIWLLTCNLAHKILIDN